MLEFNLFPTVIREYDLVDTPGFNVLKDFVDAQQTRPHRLVSGAESSYGTGKNLLDNMLLREIKQKLSECVNEYTNSMGIEPVQITNSWFNKLGQHQRVDNHRHEMSVISGAFYLNVDANSVGLKVHSPLASLRMFENIITQTAQNSNFVELNCKEGLLILFPSWLEHSTDINKTDSRITVSFNTNYQSKR